MRDQLSDLLFQLPTARFMLEEIVKDLVNRRGVLVFLAQGFDGDWLGRRLHRSLSQREFWVVEVWLPDLPGDRPPILALADALGVSWTAPETPRTILSLLQSGELPEIVRLSGFERLDAAARERWADLILQWAQASHILADRGCRPPAFCLPVSMTAFPRGQAMSDIHLAIHWWWGAPSALEMQMLCRTLSDHHREGPALVWREYVIPSLVGTDLELLVELWEALHLTEDELLRRLCGCADRRGWSAEVLREWGADTFRPSAVSRWNGWAGHPPAVAWRTLWAHGVVEWTVEYGLQLHVAAAAVLARRDEIRHRLWRGQSRLLLPLLDRIRLTVCDHLTARYGDEWPVRWGAPSSPEETNEVRENPRACQWGHLESLLRQCPPLRSEGRLLPLVSLSRRIRNEIAHYRPVTFAEFQQLTRETERLLRQTTLI